MAKINLDKLQAKSNGNIETVIGAVDLPNGALVALGAVVDGNREAVNAVSPADDKELLLVAAPEVKYDESLDQLDIVTKMNNPVRAFHLTVGDKFQVEQSLFVAPPGVGAIVTGNGDYQYVENVSGRTTFEVEALTTFGHDARKMALLRVLTV